jgi:quercetin dioxygenase-like cupin family protein
VRTAIKYSWIPGATFAALLAIAQTPGFERKVLQTADLSTPGKQAAVVEVIIQPGASIGRHTHPGEEATQIVEGQGELTVAGQPAKTVKAGEAFVVPSGVAHDICNTGTTRLRASVVFIVDKGKPLATPAP